MEIRNPDAPIKPRGYSTTIDLYDCNTNIINPEKIEEFINILCDIIKVKKSELCKIIYSDELKCYIMNQYIKSSLISGQFVKEAKSIYLDIFSCKSFVPKEIGYFAKKFFEANDIKISSMERK